VGAVKLNGPLVAGGDVANQDYNGPRFAISADGSRVVYLADQEVDDQFQLFGAPIDGSAAPVKLSGTIAGNADVRSFQLDPTGTRAVYVADALTNTMFELFIVPVDGSAAPLRLNSPFADGGDVANPYNGQWSFQITPDGSAVLYVADQREDGVFELFGAPLDGRSSAYRLSAPLVRGGDVASFQASPDSRSVLYLADQDVNDLTELYMSFLIHDGPRGR
jgi:Tol biopolymer transport system component